MISSISVIFYIVIYYSNFKENKFWPQHNLQPRNWYQLFFSFFVDFLAIIMQKQDCSKNLDIWMISPFHPWSRVRIHGFLEICSSPMAFFTRKIQSFHLIWTLEDKGQSASLSCYCSCLPCEHLLVFYIFAVLHFTAFWLDMVQEFSSPSTLLDHSNFHGPVLELILCSQIYYD